MVIELHSLGGLPYKSFSCFVYKIGTELASKDDTTTYYYTQKHPACLLVFVDDITDKELVK